MLESNKREFVGLDVSMVACSYINGGKAPYYSIVYRENGQLMQGYSSFNIDTVSEYLRDCFIGRDRDASDKSGTVKELPRRMAEFDAKRLADQEAACADTRERLAHHQALEMEKIEVETL